jgi:hypothetical protein
VIRNRSEDLSYRREARVSSREAILNLASLERKMMIGKLFDIKTLKDLDLRRRDLA